MNASLKWYVRRALTFFLPSILAVSTAPAATWYVATNGNDAADGTKWATAKQTIQAGVDAAAAGDMVLVSNGIYATGGRTADGRKLTNRVVISRRIALRSVNGPQQTVIVGAWDPVWYVGDAAVRCVHMSGGASLDGFTITKGATSVYGDPHHELSGAGIWCEDNSATISNCVITWSIAMTNGGGVCGGTLHDCTIEMNYAENSGGGSYSSVLHNCEFAWNQSELAGGGAARCRLQKCVLTGNTAREGGGIFESELDECLLEGNSATFYGGGASASALRRCRLVFNGSDRGSGGGSARGVLYNCLIFGNSARYAGGSYADTLYNCTVAGNRTRTHYGGVLDSVIYDGIVALNGLVDPLFGRVIEDNGVGTFFSSYVGSEPGFADFDAGDLRLTRDSPCINIGSNRPWMVGAVDLDGNHRVYGGTVDAGAYEFHSTFYVATNGNDAASGSSWATAKQTIQAAVDAASDGDTVLVSNGIYATGGRVADGLLTNRVAITKAITVRSVNGQAVTTIVGAGPIGDAAVRCVYLGTNATLSGFTLANGATRSGASTSAEQSGGGVWCDTGAMVSNCMLSGNSAFSGGGSYGGVLNHCTVTGNYAAGGGGGSYNGTLNNCAITGNSAYRGGGSYNGTLGNCTLSGNSASSGGGSHNGILNNCTVTGNSAGNFGGGSEGGTLNNCTLSGNFANRGGGSYNGSLNNCTLIGNSAFWGGGSYGSTLNNCTLSRNSADSRGGGSYGSSLNNCIIWSNIAPSGPNLSGGTFRFSCTTPAPDGAGNITNDPQFVDAANSNFHLQVTSPCIDAGSNSNVVGSTDVDGNLRIVNGTVDMGAFESQAVGVFVQTSPLVGGTASGDGIYFAGSNATLQAVANDYWLFVDWNDGDTNPTRTISVPSSNVTYTVNFAPLLATLTVQGSPAFGGTVIGGGTYQAGSTVTISAIAAPGWRFTGWSDGAMSATRSVFVPTTGATYTAFFRSRTPADFEGDGASDIAVYVPGQGAWSVLGSTGSTLPQVQLGTRNMVPVAADYDGDGITDQAVYHALTGTWYVRSSSSGSITNWQWGWREALPMPADYDGDGKADIATYHPSSGYWEVLRSGDGQTNLLQWGWSQAIPVSADYDGDGKADIATYVPANGTWYIVRSSGGVTQVQWGWSQAMPVPADYDGDGKADIATYVPANGTWYIVRSSGGATVQQWGWSQAAPVPADYDGDGKTDIATYHPPTGMWYILKSSGGMKQVQWGWTQAVPVLPQFQINRRWFPSP